MRGPRLVLVGILVAGVAWAEPSAWEVRGDAFLQAGNYQRALLAYETALEADPDDKVVLDKYKKTYLLVLSEQKVEADAGRTGSLNRMGALPPQVKPEPEAEVDPQEPAEEAGEAPEAGAEGKPTLTPETKGDGEAPAAGDAPATTAEGEGAAPEETDTIRVREDGTIELRFGRLNRMGAATGPSRLGGAQDTPGEDEEPEEEEDPEPSVFGGGQTVAVSQPKLGFEGAQGDEVTPENTVIQTTKYRIENVKLSYRGRALQVAGTLTNVSGNLIKLPRVYVSIFDESGLLRGRNFGYISPGRNLLARGATKKFKVDFRGYSDPVASYRIEVIP
jgi:hypothetical protein